MNPILGWALAVVFAAVAWRQYGWQGLAFAVSAIAFWLLLQFNRVVRVMKSASDAPVGRVDSAVMLNAQLQRGMPMIKVVPLTRSLGRKVGDEPETWAWHDAGGSSVTLVFVKGRLASWRLERPAQAPTPAP